LAAKAFDLLLHRVNVRDLLDRLLGYLALTGLVQVMELAPGVRPVKVRDVGSGLGHGRDLELRGGWAWQRPGRREWCRCGRCSPHGVWNDHHRHPTITI
jgi:hypothetical protein